MFGLKGNLQIKKFQCKICQKMFGQNRYLEVHLKAVHENMKEYQSNICQKMFKQNSHLEVHLKIVHRNRKEFQCNI